MATKQTTEMKQTKHGHVLIESCICLDSIHKESDVTCENVKTIDVFYCSGACKMCALRVCVAFLFCTACKVKRGGCHLTLQRGNDAKWMQEIKQMTCVWFWRG